MTIPPQFPYGEDLHNFCLFYVTQRRSNLSDEVPLDGNY
jgi:hypothetical protein